MGRASTATRRSLWTLCPSALLLFAEPLPSPPPGSDSFLLGLGRPGTPGARLIGLLLSSSATSSYGATTATGFDPFSSTTSIVCGTEVGESTRATGGSLACWEESPDAPKGARREAGTKPWETPLSQNHRLRSPIGSFCWMIPSRSPVETPISNWFVGTKLLLAW